jgi:hypothetical protein
LLVQKNQQTKMRIAIIGQSAFGAAVYQHIKTKVKQTNINKSVKRYLFECGPDVEAIEHI